MNARNAIFACLLGAVSCMTGCAQLPSDTDQEHLAREVSERMGVPVAVPSPDQIEPAVGELTTDSAVRLALHNNPEINRIFARYGVSQASYLQEATLPNPVFDVEAIWEDGETNLDVDLGFHLLSILKLGASRDIAESELRAAAHEAADRILAVRKEVLAAWYQQVADRQLLELREWVVQASAAGLEFAERLRQAGNITALDLAKEKAQKESAEVALRAARGNVLASRERLARALGQWQHDQWSVADRLPFLPSQELDTDQLQKRIVSRSLALARHEQLLQAQYRRLGIERSTRLVDELDLAALGERHNGHWEEGLGVGISVPIFDPGQARTRKGEQQLLMLEAEHRIAILTLNSHVREASARLAMARELVEFDIDRGLPLAGEILVETQKSYNAMQVGFFELIMARQQRIAAGESFVAHLRDYWLARNQLGHLLAGGSGLDQVMLGSAPGSSMSQSSGGH